MDSFSLYTSVKNWKRNISIPLLILLLVFTIDKVILKFAGIGLLFLLNPDISFRSKSKQLPWFYVFIIFIEVLKFFFLNKDFTTPHTITFIVGCLFWLLSFFALYQASSILKKESRTTIDNTILVFFIINASFSLGQLVVAMIQSGSLNPYWLHDVRFGTSTGDLIKGIFMGPSYLNMMINSFLVFYFLFRKQFVLAFIAVFIAALTTSNFANIILLFVLILCFIFYKQRSVRLAISGYFVFLIAFYLLAAPSNMQYLKDSILINKKQQQELIFYEMKINRSNKDSSLLISSNNKYGKVVAFRQTYDYVMSGTKPFFFGAGIGSYSSFLALRMSKLNEAEGSKMFHYLPTYIAPDFEKDHYKIFKTIYSLPPEFHSIKHFPNSFINQLFGEYGMVGTLLFLLTYVMFFLKRFKKLSYGRYLLLLLAAFLLFDYLFEYLSVVVIFELLILKDIQSADTTLYKQ